MQKSFYFSFELLFSFILILFVFFLFFSFFSEKINAEKEQNIKLKLYLNSIKFLDAIIKTNDENFGAAINEEQLKRVKENFLSLEKLKNINFNFFEEKGINLVLFKVSFKDYSINLIEKNINKENCITIERFALVDGRKALISLKVCDSNEFKSI